MPPLNLAPTLSSSELQRFPYATAIMQEYLQADDRWIMDRIIPVFPADTDRPYATVWPAAAALPSQQRTLGSQGSGAEVGIEAPEYVDFQVNQNQLTAKIPDREFQQAPATDPNRPYRRRAKRAAGFLKLENELRGISYFTPTDPLWAGGASNPLGDSGASQILDPGHDWRTYNPETDDFISEDHEVAYDLFDKLNGMLPNFRIIDTVTNQFFIRKLAKERKATVFMSGQSTDYADLFPTAANKVLGGALTLVPGARSEGTPADANFNPQRVWGDFPWMILGYSPTLDGSYWDESGDAYAANAEYVPDGEIAFETYAQRDPVEMHKQTFMWWNFNRAIQVLKPTLVVAVRVRP